MKNSYSAQQFITGIIVAIVVAGAFGYLLGSRAGGVSDTIDSAAGKEDILDLGAVLLGTTSISVGDNKPGLMIALSRVSLENDAWIAIHEDQEGIPGKILGAKRYRKGTTEETSIELLRQTAAGTYYAMVHTDDGNGTFDHTKDTPVLENGSPVAVKFTVSAPEK